MDAEKIAWGLRLMANDLGFANSSVRHRFLDAVEAGADLIEQLTEPKTLGECRAVLNARGYLFDVRPEGQGEWIESPESPGVLFNGFDSLTLFEATAIVRAFLLEASCA